MSLQIQVANPHGLCIPLAITEASTEKRVELAGYCLMEGEEVGHVLSITEGHFPLLAIQHDTHLFQQALGLQMHRRCCSRPVHTVVPQAYSPVAILWAQFDFGNPVHRVCCHTQVPLGLVAHPDLPVMSPTLEGFFGQHIHTLQETAG